MSRLGPREHENSSVEEEREALRRQRQAAAEELDRMKRELAERVRAVHEKERQLDEALGRLPAGRTQRETQTRAVLPAPDPRAALPPPDPTAEQLARVEARLAELREAEKVFLRTQEELAVRSEALAARERLVGARERELDAAEDGAGGGLRRSDLAEVEARLRRLESRPAAAGEDTESFAGGLESLRRRGTRRPPVR